MASMHILGTIHGATDMGDGMFFCRWKLHAGRASWDTVEGDLAGQTQTAEADTSTPLSPVDWSHPLDLHMTAVGIQDWPQLTLEVWRHDPATSRNTVEAYGTLRLPKAPGRHTRVVHLWSPRPPAWGAAAYLAALLGLTTARIDGGATANFVGANRSGMQTTSSGSVVVEVNLMQAGFGELGVLRGGDSAARAVSGEL